MFIWSENVLYFFPKVRKYLWFDERWKSSFILGLFFLSFFIIFFYKSVDPKGRWKGRFELVTYISLDVVPSQLYYPLGFGLLSLSCPGFTFKTTPIFNSLSHTQYTSFILFLLSSLLRFRHHIIHLIHWLSGCSINEI